MMSRTSEERISECTAALDMLWLKGEELLKESWKAPAATASQRSIAIKRVATEMRPFIEQLLDVPLHMGTEDVSSYSKHEDLLVQSVSRLLKLDLKLGTEYRKKFNCAQRSYSANWKMLRAEAGARFIAIFDDARR
jgi:hypothetical protein